MTYHACYFGFINFTLDLSSDLFYYILFVEVGEFFGLASEFEYCPNATIVNRKRTMLYYKFIVFSEKSRMGGEFRIRIIQNTNGLKFEINYRELSRQGNDGLIVAL